MVNIHFRCSRVCARCFLRETAGASVFLPSHVSQVPSVRMASGDVKLYTV